MMEWQEFQKWCAAVCMWREARGETPTLVDSLRGVCHVIKNRSDQWNKSWAQIVYQPLQFSSMTYGHDPQLVKVPVEPDQVFEQCYEIAELIWMGGDYDLTMGATHYFADTIPAPSWASTMVKTVQIGHHIFFKKRDPLNAPPEQTST